MPILWGAAAILLFDTVGSVTSRFFTFRYSRLEVGSFLIYFMVGFATARTSSPGAAMVAGALVAFVDATLGWGISWLVGPGRLADAQASTLRIVRTIATVTLYGALCGLLGGRMQIFAE